MQPEYEGAHRPAAFRHRVINTPENGDNRAPVSVFFVKRVIRRSEFLNINRRGAVKTIVNLSVRGRGWVRLDGQRHELPSGAAWAIRAHEPNVMGVEPGHEHELLQVALHGTGVDHLITSTCGYGAWRPRNPGAIQRQFECLFEEAAIHEDHQHAVLLGQLEALLHLLARRQERSSRADAAHETFEACREYALAHLDELTTVTALSDAMGISRTHLDRLFKRYAGRSPKEWLRNARASLGCDMLLDDERSLESIANAMNYSSAFALSRSFKAAFGIPPSVWRTEAAG